MRSAAQPIDNSFLTRRAVLRGAAVGALAAPFLHRAATAEAAPTGRLVLAWHTNIAARWLDPQQHDGTASPDNFLMAVHDAVIKSFREVKYDHPALAEKFDFAEDAASAVLRLRNGSKFHDGTPVTPADVKWSYEHYRGAWGDVLKAKTDGVEIVGADTVRFHFKEPFPDFPILLGTANVCGAGWVVPAKYYEQSGPDGFVRKPIGAGPLPSLSFKRVASPTSSRLIRSSAFPFWPPHPLVKRWIELPSCRLFW